MLARFDEPMIETGRATSERHSDAGAIGIGEHQGVRVVDERCERPHSALQACMGREKLGRYRVQMKGWDSGGKVRHRM